MSRVVDGLLLPPDDSPFELNNLKGKAFMRYLMDFIEENIEKHGDWDFIVNADLGEISNARCAVSN